ncbi:TPA: hypothetical protein N0F65_008859 [Lagenidium giganteum]|uniref:glucan endo-1,3-beta-D-glucosidase n=1 Tax=Lagenidium giganteum TaxID=4803 RepID=A0AAV2YC81_9STRA|nr:TPA: hypothetical protein N0F65_008859 [Lagenidium giganteum]
MNKAHTQADRALGGLSRGGARVARWLLLSSLGRAVFLAIIVAFAYKSGIHQSARVAHKAPLQFNDAIFQALSTDLPPPGFLSRSDKHRKLLAPRFVSTGKPIPTNKWWANLIAFSKDKQVQSVWTNPYSVRPSIAFAPYGLHLNYPSSSRVYGGRSGNKQAINYYFHGLHHKFTFSAREFTEPPSLRVFDWDDVGVKIRMHVGDESRNIQSSLVSGMAYVSAQYTDLTLLLVSINAITHINGKEAVHGMEVRGDRFVVELYSGQKWVLYLSSEITLQLESVTELQALGTFTGIARIAYVVNDESLVAYDQYRQCVVNGGDVHADDDEDTYTFEWKTSGDCGSGLLQFAQTHHMETLGEDSAIALEGVETYSTTRGKLQALVTSTQPPVWRLYDPLEMSADFYPEHRMSDEVAAKIKISEVLLDEIYANWKLTPTGSYYFNGKLAQKYASLCLMAHDDVTVPEKDRARVRRDCIDKLEDFVTPLMNNKMRYPLVYDTVYGGVISSEGLDWNNVYDADFGNTMYNDHHYHYGYWIMTAAIINLLDPTWQHLTQFNHMINLLVRDVANPSTDDPYFPKFRNFDWYRGHSYSHGITTAADGKDEESTSEDINFHFALMLYGRATNNSQVERIGRLMLKLNARAVRTYFLLTDDSKVHPPDFTPNKVTGILFDNKVDYTTWFSKAKYCIHGIQMLPVSTITPFVRTKQFVQEEWDQVLSKERIVLKDDFANAWLSILYTNYAAVNKEVAMEKLQHTNLDDGLSRAWALYMAATQPE